MSKLKIMSNQIYALLKTHVQVIFLSMLHTMTLLCVLRNDSDS